MNNKQNKNYDLYHNKNRKSLQGEAQRLVFTAKKLTATKQPFVVNDDWRKTAIFVIVLIN